MIAHYAQLIFALALVLSGCRSRDPSIDLLEAELRWTEDQLYLAEEEYRRRTRELETCLAREKSLQEQLKEQRNSLGESDRVGPHPPGVSSPALNPAQSDVLREPDTLEQGAVGAPEQSPPEPSDQDPNTGTSPLLDADSRDPKIEVLIPEAHIRPLDLALPTSFASSAGPQDKLAIRAACRLYGGIDFAGEKGSEGIEVKLAFEPPSQQPPRTQGRITVVAIDPDQRQHVARWDLEPTEVESLQTRSPHRSQLTLRLRWPRGYPDVQRLLVYVRFTLADGTRLYAKQSLDVGFAREVAHAWTPAAKHPKSPESSGNAEQNNVDSVNSDGLIDPMERVPDTRPKRPIWRPYR